VIGTSSSLCMVDIFMVDKTSKKADVVDMTDYTIYSIIPFINKCTVSYNQPVHSGNINTRKISIYARITNLHKNTSDKHVIIRTVGIKLRMPSIKEKNTLYGRENLVV
jgi:hypothetical protein